MYHFQQYLLFCRQTITGFSGDIRSELRKISTVVSDIKDLMPHSQEGSQPYEDEDYRESVTSGRSRSVAPRSEFQHGHPRSQVHGLQHPSRRGSYEPKSYGAKYRGFRVMNMLCNFLHNEMCFVIGKETLMALEFCLFLYVQKKHFGSS